MSAKKENKSTKEHENKQESKIDNSENKEIISLKEENKELQDKLLRAKADSENKEIISLKEEIKELQDKLLRAKADSENIRKRIEKQVEDTAKYGISGFAKELLNVMDNLYRTSDVLKTADIKQNDFLQGINDGVEITKKEFISVFKKFGIQRIMPKEGSDFDHNYHQAVAQVKSDKYGKGKIVTVMQAGYTIHNRLLRAAMVSVAADKK